MGFKSPNYTQMPNTLIDDMMPQMSNAALRVLIVVIRRTIGFHRRVFRCSISGMEALTGLSRQAVQDGASEAEGLGVLQRMQDGGVTIWAVVMDSESGTPCPLCGNSEKTGAGFVEDEPLEMNVHHIMPREYGGGDEKANKITICAPCHAALHKRANLAIKAGQEPTEKYFRKLLGSMVVKGLQVAMQDSSTENGKPCKPVAQTVLASSTPSKKESIKQTVKESAPATPAAPAPVSDHHVSLVAFREVRGRWPAKECWEQIIATVGDQPAALTLWRDVLTAWSAAGYSPTRIDGPLDWFRAGGAPNRKPAGQQPRQTASARAHTNRTAAHASYNDYWDAKMTARGLPLVDAPRLPEPSPDSPWYGQTHEEVNA